MALTPKQKLFVDEYLIDLNATQAAIRAGYRPSNAEQMGYQLLQKTSVSDAIKTAMAERFPTDRHQSGQDFDGAGLYRPGESCEGS